MVALFTRLLYDRDQKINGVYMLRFAPSPKGDMHTESLRVALFNYIVAKQKDDKFIVRIDDRDKEQNLEGKDTEILEILEKFALPHDRVFHQSENLHIHQTLAIRLFQENKAFVCTCNSKELEPLEEERVSCSSGKCENMTIDELARLKKEQIPFVLRLKKPNNTITSHDLILGNSETLPDEVDNFIILRSDSTPTQDFACACDDMLSDIDFIIRSEDCLSNTPKQIYIKQLLGYDKETNYAHLPNILNDSGKKMNISDDASSVKWLFAKGFIPDAIINYLILLGNKTPKEIFTLPEALEWFNLESISKTKAKFDLNKLRFINREHLRLMDDKRLSTLFGFADGQIGKLAKVYLEEASTINELEVRIKAIFSPKSFDGELGEQMRTLEQIIYQAKPMEEFNEFKKMLIQKSGLQEENLDKPLRILLTGADNGPDLSDIYPHIKSYILEIAS